MQMFCELENDTSSVAKTFRKKHSYDLGKSF